MESRIALCMDCKLVETVENSLNENFIGEIMGIYSEERFLSDRKSDFKKMRTLHPFST